MKGLARAPFPVKYRELWLPRSINGNATLPSARYNGHALTLTGAIKATTADGVHGNGSANSNIVIAAEAAVNNQPKWGVFLRFKFDLTWTIGSGTQYICTKRLDANNFIDIYFDTATGQLTFTQTSGGGAPKFTVRSGAWTSFTGGVWYTALMSISDVGPTQRIEINGIVAGTDSQPAFNTPNGGDTVILNSAAGAANGFQGTVSWFVCQAADITAAEDSDMVNGIPPAASIYSLLMDEGSGTTANNRGSGGNSGTLGSTVTWAFGHCRQPVLSSKGIGASVAASAAAVYIKEPVTLVLAEKMKSTYNSLANLHQSIQAFIDGDNYIDIFFDPASNTIKFNVRGNALENAVSLGNHPLIDDYWIIIGTLNSGGELKIYKQGSLVNSATGVGPMSAAGATVRIANKHTLVAQDISKPLFAALIEGAFTAKQVLIYSRWLNDILGMRISL